VSGFQAAITGAGNLLPVGLAVVVTTVANGLLSAELKARLVFLRWKHALPGHRAFSVYAKNDPRIDFVRLQRALGNKLPVDAEAERPGIVSTLKFRTCPPFNKFTATSFCCATMPVWPRFS
jgi:hypothetical protein